MRFAAALVGVCLGGAAGCRDAPVRTQHFQPTTLAIEAPALEPASLRATAAPLSAPPRTAQSAPPEQFRDITLPEAIRVALEQSEVMRSLGGRTVSTPGAIASVFDPAIAESDPLYGPQGALSAFDPQLTMNTNWIRNDRGLNNILQGGGTRDLKQEQWNYQSGLKKIAATGDEFTLRGITEFNSDNGSGNLFPSAWDTQLETSVRHPFLQGSGVQFNRIAGPNSQPGFYFSNGVLLARIRTDLSLADFEAGVAGFVGEVESAYWELYAAYRELDAKTLARDSAWEAWQHVGAKRAQGLPGGEVDREADARERFFRAQDELENALGGVGKGTGEPRRGLYSAERRLRMLMGLPADDGQFLRPGTTPPESRLHVDWDQAAAEALARRSELRKQRWLIKQRELELIAARNFRLPSFDVVGLYRLRGFGDNLTGSNTGRRFNNSMQDVASLDHQEWQVGLELDMPLGLRRGIAAVRHAELQLARERSVLREQEREILHELGEAVAASARAYAAVGNAYHRLAAAEELSTSSQAAFFAEKINMEQWYSARSRLSDARSHYYQALVEHAEASKNLQSAKGSLLDYNGVYLNETPWPREVRADADRMISRWRTSLLDYRIVRPSPVGLSVGRSTATNVLEAPAPTPPAAAALPAGEFLPPPAPSGPPPETESNAVR